MNAIELTASGLLRIDCTILQSLRIEYKPVHQPELRLISSAHLPEMTMRVDILFPSLVNQEILLSVFCGGPLRSFSTRLPQSH